MRKTVMALLLVMSLLGTTAGIAAVTVTAPGEFPIVTEPITLTATVVQTPVQIDFNDVQILKDFEEKSGINVEYTCIPSDMRLERLNLMLASADVTDILYKMQVSITDQAKYGADGLFLPMSDYYDYMPNLRRWYDEFPTAEAAVTLPDGKSYGLPYILAGYAIRMGGRMYFNSDVLEKAGYDHVPTTLDELTEFFRAIKGWDYNGTGNGDAIPLSSSTVDYIQNVFKGSFGLNNRGSSHPNVFVNKDGDLAFQYISPNYREELRYLNMLYTEGLLDQDIFTNDQATMIAKCSTGQVLTYVFVNNSFVSNSPYEEFTVGMKEPFTGPNGDKIWGMYSLPSSSLGMFVMTYTNKYPEATARWADYWYSDQGILEYFMGIEGVTYEADAASPGGYKLTDFVLKNPDGRDFETVLGAYVPWAGGGNPSVATNEFFKGGETWPCSLEAAAGLINYVPEIVWPAFTYAVEAATELSSIQLDMDTYLKEWRANFITGQRSLDADWDEFVGGYEALRLPRYMEIYKAAAAAYMAK